MSVDGLGWLGVRTDRFEETVSFYRDLLGLDAFRVDETSVRFRLGDGTELHVYGPADVDHEFFGTAPAVGLLVDDVPAVRRRMEAAGIEFFTQVEQAGASAWCHFRGPDGNVYDHLAKSRLRDRLGCLEPLCDLTGRAYTRAISAVHTLQIETLQKPEMRGGTSRLSFLMCTFCAGDVLTESDNMRDHAHGGGSA